MFQQIIGRGMGMGTGHDGMGWMNHGDNRDEDCGGQGSLVEKSAVL
jgi:hypothetical protein